MNESVQYKKYRATYAVCENPLCPKPGRKYVRTNPAHRFCCRKCRDEVRWGRRVCPVCSRAFVPKPNRYGGPRVYCSRECYERSLN